MPNDADITRYIWNEENLNKYRDELIKRDLTKAKYPWEPDLWAATRKLFFINPIGSLEQNMETISIVINYMRYIPEDTLLKLLLTYDPPLLSVEFMSETEPRSCQFQHRKLDLLEQIIKKGDAGLLRKLYQYIDLSSYHEYADEIEALIKEETRCE